MVLAIVDIRVSSAKSEELRRALLALTGPVGTEPGCTGCSLYQNLTYPGVLRFESRWNTQDNLFRHIKSDTYKRFLTLMELGSEPPIIEFYTVSELHGLDLIMAARETY